jgi:outer membrane protein assembly factor BamB
MLVGAADGKLHAVANGGSYLWGFPTDGRVYSSPLPDGHDIYFGSDDGRLYKVDIDSGILLWEFATKDKIRSSPALVNKRVYFASYDGHLYCLNTETGLLVWKSPLAKYTRASPAVHAGRVYIGDEDGRASCFNAANGSRLWSHELGGYISRCPLVAPDGVAFVSDQGTAALIDHSGKVRWQRKLGVRLTGQPVITQNQLLVPSDKQLFVLVRASGQPDNRFTMPDPSENFVDVTAYRDRLYWVQRRVNVVEYGNRNFAEFRSQVGVWQPETKEK